MRTSQSMRTGMPIIVCLLLTANAVRGQSFMLMRFDEDYLPLKDSVRNAYSSFKYLPLSRSNSGYPYLSAGGEIRAEYDYVRNEDWGENGLGTDPYFTARFNVHTDLHLHERIRLFAQLRSAQEDGRNNGPRPIDEDRLNIQNLFLDLTPFRSGKNSARLRLGRQEVNYGSGRLISVQEGPNARLYFDGAKVMYESTGFTFDAFALAAARVKPGVFDNVTSKKPGLWGGYGTLTLAKAGSLDLYYIGFRQEEQQYEEGIASEQRHTYGLRFWRKGNGFNYNLEAAWQSGKFGNRRIQAWTGSVDIAYRFDEITGGPLAGLRNDYISGDESPDDGKLQTFNPIYPKAGYFGFNPQLGPVNLIDIHPYFTWNAGSRVLLTLDMVFNWRYSLRDGVYRPNGRFSTGSRGSDKRYIGTVFLTGVEWQINEYLAFNSGVQYFKIGAFINDIIDARRDGFFMSYQAQFKF